MKKLIIVISALMSLVMFSGVSSAMSSPAKEDISKVAKVEQIKKVNLNTAGAQEIADALTGVGLKKATAIVEYRKTNGNFKKIEDLAAVKGIGVATIAKNESRILL